MASLMTTPLSSYSTMTLLQVLPSVSPAAPTGLTGDEVMTSLPTSPWRH